MALSRRSDVAQNSDVSQAVLGSAVISYAALAG
jgi:hypothetical protein